MAVALLAGTLLALAGFLLTSVQGFDRNAVLGALRGFKRRTSPPATLALLSAIGVFVLGGAVHTRALPSWYHLAASVVAVGIHLWAFLAEWSAFLDNGRLMADPAAYVRIRPARR